jgi:hypothetical protein
MFTVADKIVFMNEVDPQVLIRVVGEVNNYNIDASGEDVEKN